MLGLWFESALATLSLCFNICFKRASRSHAKSGLENFQGFSDNFESLQYFSEMVAEIVLSSCVCVISTYGIKQIRNQLRELWTKSKVSRLSYNTYSSSKTRTVSCEVFGKLKPCLPIAKSIRNIVSGILVVLKASKTVYEDTPLDWRNNFSKGSCRHRSWLHKETITNPPRCFFRHTMLAALWYSCIHIW